MQRVFVDSDESKHRAADLFVVAGIALTGYFDDTRQRLLQVEEESGKGVVKWQRATNPRTRRRYLAGVLGIKHLRGSAFYRAFRDTHAEPVNPYWSTVETLGMVVNHFGAGRAAILVHQGLNYETRRNLRSYLQDTGHNNVRVEPGNMATEPRVRLADTLAGFCALLHSNSAMLDTYNGLPYGGWFLNLGE
jgi:hypothetical protein